MNVSRILAAYYALRWDSYGSGALMGQMEAKDRLKGSGCPPRDVQFLVDIGNCIGELPRRDQMHLEEYHYSWLRARHAAGTVSACRRDINAARKAPHDHRVREMAEVATETERFRGWDVEIYDRNCDRLTKGKAGGRWQEILRAMEIIMEERDLFAQIEAVMHGEKPQLWRQVRSA